MFCMYMFIRLLFMPVREEDQREGKMDLGLCAETGLFPAFFFSNLLFFCLLFLGLNFCE